VDPAQPHLLASGNLGTTRRRPKTYRAHKGKHAPRVSRADWPEEIPPSNSQKFKEKILAVSWADKIYPRTPEDLERFIAAWPGQLSLERGDSRYLKYLPPDERRQQHMARQPLRSTKTDYTDAELRYACGECLYMDAGHVPKPCFFKKLAYAIVFCCRKCDYGIVFPTKDITARSYAAAICYAVNLMKQNFDLTVRAIATDAASAITATELDHLKLELHVKFEVIGRYAWHADSAAERYIKRVFDTAQIGLVAFRSAIVQDRVVNTDEFLLLAIIWACRILNVSPSGALHRREHMLLSPHSFLAGINGNYELPYSVVPFGAKCRWHPPQAHKRATMEVTTKSQSAYYMFPAGFLPIAINADGPFTGNRHEHVLLTMKGNFVTTAAFQPVELMPSWREHTAAQIITRFTAGEQSLLRPHAPIAPPNSDDYADMEDITPGSSMAEPVTANDTSPTSDQQPAAQADDTPDDEAREPAPEHPLPRLRPRGTRRRPQTDGDLDAIPRSRKSKPAPTPSEVSTQPASQRSQRQVTAGTIPANGTRIEVYWPQSKKYDGSCWWPAVIASKQNDLRVINSDLGVPLPIDECRVIVDVSATPHIRYVKHLHPNLYGKTWRLPRTSAPRRRHIDLSAAAANTAYSKIESSVPPIVFEEAKQAAKHDAMQHAFDELERTEIQFAGVSEGDRTEDQKEQPSAGLEKFKDTVDITSFKTAGGSADDLLRCFLAGILEPKLDETDFQSVITFKSFMDMATKEYRPAVSPERIAQELRANGYWPPASNGDKPHATSQSSPSVDETHLDVNPEEIASTLFTADRAPAVHAAIQRGAECLKDDDDPHHFGQNLDPNLDLVSDLLNVDVSEVTGLYVQFDAEAQHPGDGPDVKPGDFCYDPEQIVELRGMSPEDKRKYLEAIVREFEGIAAKGVRRIALCPSDRIPLPTKLVLKVKYHASGAYDKHKARAVVKGFLSKIGVDYYATFAPTTMLSTARIVLAVATQFGVPVHHADVPQAFLQGNVNRPIFVSPPKGISVKSHILDALKDVSPRGRYCFRLVKSLYGLASSPHLFSKLMSEFLVNLGMERSLNDCTLFTRYDSDTGKWCLVTAFVDDLLITGTDVEFQNQLKAALRERFGTGLSWCEKLESFLGLHCQQSADNRRITVNARFKIDELFNKLNEGSNLQWHPAKAPQSSDFQGAREYPSVDLTPRQRVVAAKFRTITGVLIYISITCRPDIAPLLNKCCQGAANPERIHVVWLEKLLCYLHGTRNTGLVFDPRSNPIKTEVVDPLAEKYPELADLRDAPYVCFTDANFADVTDKKLRSTTGFILYVWNCPIAWHSKRQTVTAKSTLEAELIAACSGADECIWLFYLVKAVLISSVSHLLKRRFHLFRCWWTICPR